MKTAVVIGATGNLGQAVVEIFSKNGYELDQQWLREDHPDATLLESYLNLPSRIDVAIYLAGLNTVKAVTELSAAEWRRVIDVNLTGLFFLAKGASIGLRAAAMTGGNPVLIGISSIMATHPYPNRSAYATAKAGVEGLIRELAVEWGPDRIATHAIRLGHLRGLMKSTPANPKLLDSVVEHVPLGNLIEPEEVARYLYFIAEGGARSLNGQVTDFDGGYTINRWPL